MKRITLSKKFLPVTLAPSVSARRLWTSSAAERSAAAFIAAAATGCIDERRAREAKDLLKRPMLEGKSYWYRQGFSHGLVLGVLISAFSAASSWS